MIHPAKSATAQFKREPTAQELRRVALPRRRPTPADQACLQAAAEKRARKAARNRALAVKGAGDA